MYNLPLFAKSPSILWYFIFSSFKTIFPCNVFVKYYTKVRGVVGVLPNICDALSDLVPFVQFKKRENHPWKSVTFSKVTD